MRSIAHLPTATPKPASTFSKLYGIDDPSRRSHKFGGPGMYAFGRGGGFPMHCLWAELDGTGHLPGHINLSAYEGAPVVFTLSPQSFDGTCWGVAMTVAQAEAGR